VLSPKKKGKLGLVFAFGGYDGKEVLKSWEVYNTGTRKWKEVGKMMTPREWMGACILDDNDVDIDMPGSLSEKKSLSDKNSLSEKKSSFDSCTFRTTTTTTTTATTTTTTASTTTTTTITTTAATTNLQKQIGCSKGNQVVLALT